LVTAETQLEEAMELQEKKYWMAVQEGMQVGSLALARQVLAHYGSMEAFWKAKDTVRLEGATAGVREKLMAMRSAIDPDRLLEACMRSGAGVVCAAESDYPRALLPYGDSPMALYTYGELGLVGMAAASVVGSRRCSAYGRMMAARFGAAFAEAGLCVVSGMAKGIDAAAHEGSLSVQGKTIAVLGCGPDVAYPPECRALYGRIREKGLILSEYVPGTPPESWRFPPRNRIISALGRFLLLVEGQARSGALITCGWASEQGKDVWAIPGAVTNPYSIAPLKLIQDGAYLAITPEDVVRAYYPEGYGKVDGTSASGAGVCQAGSGQASGGGSTDGGGKDASAGQGTLFTMKEALKKLSSTERNLLDNISFYPVHVDQLLTDRGCDLYLDLTNLLHLRLIERIAGDYYQRV